MSQKATKKATQPSKGQKQQKAYATPEFKEMVVKEALNAQAGMRNDVARKHGISKMTLYRWMHDAGVAVARPEVHTIGAPFEPVTEETFEIAEIIDKDKLKSVSLSSIIFAARTQLYIRLLNSPNTIDTKTLAALAALEVPPGEKIETVDQLQKLINDYNAIKNPKSSNAEDAVIIGSGPIETTTNNN